jgi:hypothetical protein
MVMKFRNFGMVRYSVLMVRSGSMRARAERIRRQASDDMVLIRSGQISDDNKTYSMQNNRPFLDEEDALMKIRDKCAGFVFALVTLQQIAKAEFASLFRDAPPGDPAVYDQLVLEYDALEPLLAELEREGRARNSYYASLVDTVVPSDEDIASQIIS